MLGGAVNGGKILGEYPKNFTHYDETSCGRGRLVPTTSWDALWNGVAQWFGVTDDADLNYVIPNRKNFGCRLFTDKDLFKGGKQKNLGCNGDTVLLQKQLTTSETRYFTAEEEVAFCDILISFLQPVAGSALRCVVMDQVITFQEGGAVLDITSEIVTDKMGFAQSALEQLNANTNNILSEIQNSAIIALNVTNVGEVVELTSST